MIDVKQMVRGFVAVAFALVAANASGQVTPAQTPDTQKPFEPSVSQPGKDVVWVPTPQPTVDNMLALTKVTPQDYLIDLGSGDGITVISAAKKGARAQGVEFEGGGCLGPGDVRQGRPVRGGPVEGDGDYAVPVAQHQPPAAAVAARAETRDADRVEHVRHGRLATRRRGLVVGVHVVVQGADVGGAGQGRRHVAGR